MVLYLAIDDTDMPDSIGTGRLAREIAEEITTRYPVLAVTRHQFCVHPDIPYTSHNSGAVIHVSGISDDDLTLLTEQVISIMKNRFVQGSDPGLCLARREQITAPLIVFGQDAKSKVLTQEQARKLAAHLNIRLYGLGGTNGGIIGALAGVGLAATGFDGRFLQIGTIREHPGQTDVSTLLASGIEAVLAVDGRELQSGAIQVKKFPQPAVIFGKAFLLVEEVEGQWHAVRRD
jgi:hypothetical protein